MIQPDQTVQPRPIEIEINEGDISVISRGLNEGEQVVADGQNQLRAGAKVSTKPAGQPGRAPKPEARGPAPEAR